MKKPKVYVAIPSVGTIADGLPHLMRDWEKAYAEKIEFVYPENCVQRKFHDFARNAIVEDFLATDCDILWFIDSDVLPPHNAPDLITKYGEHWELAGIPYGVFMRAQPDDAAPSVVMCVYQRDEKGLHAANCPQSGTGFVAGLATGCMMIKREVFAQLETPYFEFKYDPKTRYMTEGEDLGFCRKVGDRGYAFFTDYSMVCRHYKTVDLLDVSNYARMFANRSVASYDAQIRPQIAELVERMRAPKDPSRTKSGLIVPT